MRKGNGGRSKKQKGRDEKGIGKKVKVGGGMKGKREEEGGKGEEYLRIG